MLESDGVVMGDKLEKLRQLRRKLNVYITGRENIEKDSPTVFVANHSCLMDIFYLPMAVDRPMVNMISSRIIYKNVPDRQRMVEDYLYSMPVEVHGGKEYSDMCLKSAVSLLNSGIDVGIFPEGAYLPGNTVYRGRTGVSRILYCVTNMGINAKLVPISINTHGIRDLDSYDLTDRRVDIQILEPVTYENSYEKFLYAKNVSEKNKYLHEPVDICMQRIAKSMKRPYKNEYIELTPRESIIFTDGSRVSVGDARDEKYLSRFKEELDTRRKIMQKSIMMEKNKIPMER